jgi:hypothetical protein
MATKKLTGCLVSTALAGVISLSIAMPAVAQQSPPAEGDAAKPRMAVVKNKDVHGTVYKKLGLPGEQYCWDQCVQEDRCSGARWGVIAGDKAGLCYLLSGELTVVALSDLKTEDGKRIVVTARRKTTAPRQGGPS